MALRTVCIDFDGVLHSYTSGWQGSTVINDPPVAGMPELTNKLKSMGVQIIIMSARARYPSAAKAMSLWLKQHGFAFDIITKEKMPADVYIDDRAYRFDGRPSGILQFLDGDIRPWNKGEQMRPRVRGQR